MATLTRTKAPAYKDYVSFLEAYKNGKKEDQGENSDSGVSVKNSSSSSSLNSDVTDFSKTCIPYNTFLENTKNKKFNPVKPNFEEKSQPTTKKTEIFVEIKPRRSVSEVSKMFENKQPTRNGKINSKISIFEKQISQDNKPKISENRPTSPKDPKISIFAQQISQENNRKSSENRPPSPKELKISIFEKQLDENKSKISENRPPTPQEVTQQPTMRVEATINITEPAPPPPPPMPTDGVLIAPPPPPLPPMHPPISKKPVEVKNVSKMQATLVKGPQITHSVSNPNGALPTLDRNDPMVKKLVYGTLRGLYGAYHDKANDMMATLPRNRVKKSHGVQGIIDQIASNGDLDKLNGRVNPKSEQV